MTCKDCVHYDVCMDFTKLKESEVAQNLDGAEIMCDHFKNKADFVEVVRCRECKHCEILQDEWDNDWYFCKETVNNAEVKADDFCSYGERRDT